MSLRSEVIRIVNELLGNSKKITDLNSATTPLAGSELAEVVQNGENKKVPVSELGSGGGGSTPTFQQVLTQGSVLIVDNTISSDGVIHVGTGPSAIDAASIDLDPAGDVDISATDLINFGGARITINGLAGTSGQVLTSTGSGTAPTWQTPSAGGGSVESVTGDGVDNTDPANPVLTFPTPGDIGAEVAGAAATVAGNLAAHIADAIDAHAGTAITNTPAGAIVATTIQGAINELDTEKAALASPTFTGTPAVPTAAGGTNTTQIASTAFVQQELGTAGAVTKIYASQTFK